MEYMTNPSIENKKISNASRRNTIVWNTAWVSAMTSLYTVMKKMAFDDDQPDDALAFYAEKFAWDFARGISSVVPGTILFNAGKVAVSLVDNEKWAEGLIDIPGSTEIEKGMSGIAAYIGAPDGPKGDKKEEDAIVNIINSATLSFGIPKVLVDFAREHLTEDADDKKRNRTENRSQEQSTEVVKGI
jgi:hypothetical protein